MPDLFDDGKPCDKTPMMNAFFGQPESPFDLVNQYGTYNIQPTNEQENPFPAIAQALPTAWRDAKLTKEDIERL